MTVASQITSTVTMALRRRWRCDIHSGVTVEETDRFQTKERHIGGHDRPILGMGDVVYTEGVPHHHIGVLDQTVGQGPFRQGQPGTALVHELPSWRVLLRMLWDSPYDLGDDFGAP
ncbi:hypothetical protein [Mycobacterium lepromatosis]|uniref:hypothetical protein n=1 Tax=Mycobacterium lepromatosis TaxID=480418 RepID=UPI0026BA0E48